MARCRALFGIILIAACGTAGSAATKDIPLFNELAAARADVRSHLLSPLEDLDGSEAARTALANEWDLTARAVCADLDAGGDPHADARAEGIDVELVALAPDTVLVSASVDAYGTVFIVQRADGEFHPVWTIRGLDDAQLETFPLLAAFGVEEATAACKREISKCGPMTADIGGLGEDDRGRPHFYVNGLYSTQQGNDVGYQLSVWAWDGSKAVPELSGFYHQTLDTSSDVQFKAPFLSLHAKDDWKTFYVTSPEPGRQVTWTVLMEGDGARDLGRSSAEPELDAVDELFARIRRGSPSTDIATPKVRRRMEKAFRKAGIGEDKEGSDILMGELMDSMVARGAENSSVCILVDGLEPWRFTLATRGGAYFITKAKRLGTDDYTTHANFAVRCSQP